MCPWYSKFIISYLSLTCLLYSYFLSNGMALFPDTQAEDFDIFFIPPSPSLSTPNKFLDSGDSPLSFFFFSPNINILILE